MIEFTVKTLDANDHLIRVDDDTTVYGLKQKLVEELGIDINHQRLIFYGRVLLDNKKLAQYGVHGKVVHLVERPPPRYGQRTNSNDDEEIERSRNLDMTSHQPRSLSPTRARVEFLQRSIQEIRVLMECLQSRGTWLPPSGSRHRTPDVDAVNDPGPGTSAASLQLQYDLEVSEAGPSNASPQAGPSHAGSSSASNTASDRVIITDRLGRMLEPRYTGSFSQHYAELLREFMELESEFQYYRTKYIDWIGCHNLNATRREVPDEMDESVRRKQQFSTLISEIHHSFAHAHHVISDINYLVTASAHRLTSEPILSNSPEAAMHAHFNMMQSLASEFDMFDTEVENGRRQYLQQQSRHQRRHQRHQQMQQMRQQRQQQLQQQQQQQSTAPLQQPQLYTIRQQPQQGQRPLRSHVHMQTVGLQMTPNTCRLHRSALSQATQAQSQTLLQQPQTLPQQPQTLPQQPQTLPQQAQTPHTLLQQPLTLPQQPQTVPQQPQTLAQQTQTLPKQTQALPQETQTLPQEPQTLPQQPLTLPQEPQTLSQQSQTLPQQPQLLLPQPQTLPQQPQTLPPEPQMLPQQPQTLPQQPQTLPQQSQTPAQQPQPRGPQVQFQTTTEIIMQHVAPGVHAPVLLGTPAAINISAQPNPITFQLELESGSLEAAIINSVANQVSQLVASHAAGQSATNPAASDNVGNSATASTANVTNASTTQSQGNPQMGSQAGVTPHFLGPNSGAVHLGTINLGSINLGPINTAGGVDINFQGPTNVQANQGTNQSSDGQRNQDNSNQAGRNPALMFDFENLFRGLNQAGNIGDMEIVMSLEPSSGDDDFAHGFAVNNPHLHPAVLTAAANVLAGQRPGAPMTAVSAMAAARLATAEAAAAAMRLANAEAAANAAAANAAAAQAAADRAAADEAQGADTPVTFANAGLPRRPAADLRTTPSLYIYDSFLLCNSNHARRQLGRRREIWEAARQVSQQKMAEARRRREFRENNCALSNREAINSLVRVNRPSVFSESLMVAILVSIHEATVPDNQLSLGFEEFENVRRILMIGIRRLGYMCECEAEPVTAMRLSNHLFRQYSTFIDRMSAIARFRPNVDVPASLRRVVATYMVALVAMLQQMPVATYVVSFRMLFSNMFYDLACVIVHICCDGFEGFTAIYNEFIEDLINNMEVQSNTDHVRTLASSILARVVDHIETNPSSPHQYVMRTDGLYQCICHGNSQVGYPNMPFRDQLIVIDREDPVSPPPYLAPRVGPSARDRPDSREQEEHMNVDCEAHEHFVMDDDEDYVTDDDDTQDFSSRLHIDTGDSSQTGEPPSDDDSDAYVSPIVVPNTAIITPTSGLSAFVSRAPTNGMIQHETEENLQRMIRTRNHYVSFMQSMDEYRRLHALGGGRHRPPFDFSANQDYGDVSDSNDQSPDLEYSAERETLSENAALATEMPRHRCPIHSAPSEYPLRNLPPPPTPPLPPPPMDDSEEAPMATGEPEGEASASDVFSHESSSPANKRMKQDTDNDTADTSNRARKVPLDTESKRKSPTVRERAPNQNESSSSEDSAESLRRNRVDSFPRHWMSVLEEDSSASTPVAPLSDAYLSGMTPRRRRRVRNTRPPQEAAAFMHDCMSSASEGAVEGDHAEGEVLRAFCDYVRDLAAERAAASDDYRPAYHATVAKLLNPSPTQDDQSSS